MEMDLLVPDDLRNGLRTSLPGTEKGEKIILSLTFIEENFDLFGKPKDGKKLL